MYRPRKSRQMDLYEAQYPLEDMIDPKEELCTLADHIIDWDWIDELYQSTFDNGLGRPAYPSRLAFGILFLKEKYGLTDREASRHLKQNLYFQYFCGFKNYSPKNTCDPSLLSSFRKRFTPEVMEMINEHHFKRPEEPKNDDDDDNDGHPGGETGNGEDDAVHPEKERLNGTMIIDATCCPADIKYPTDTALLQESRIWLESIIDLLYAMYGPLAKNRKPRTYRKKANKAYKIFAKDPKKLKDPKAIRRQLREQLGYAKRDLDYIDQYIKDHPEALSMLPRIYVDRLETIRIVYMQQKKMFDSRTHRCEDRIVSLSQPWVRPIVRGKAKAPTEFGAKLSISVVDGYTFVDKLSFDAYNEGSHEEFLAVVDRYKERFGHWPEKILCDKLYGNHKNRRWCKERGIHLSAPRLGRPPKNMDELARTLANDMAERNTVECKFGNMKRGGTLGRVMAKLNETAKTVIHMNVFVMNMGMSYRKLLESGLSCAPIFSTFPFVQVKVFFQDHSIICIRKAVLLVC